MARDVFPQNSDDLETPFGGHILGSYPAIGNLPTTGIGVSDYALVGNSLYRWNGSVWNQVGYTPRTYADLLVASLM